jgi:UDP-N-acetylglucosamine 2-epimerase (non-hydrolysing)
MKVINVCGARPNFMKIAPLMHAYAKSSDVSPILVHTGQHYDERMNQWFFDQLEIPIPDINLEVGSGSHAAQTAQIMTRFEPVMLEHRPDAVLVVGDVNSTVACALVASKLCVPVIHVEAGLRSFDRAMPEEINRLVTDTLSDLLFVTEPSGVENLLNEGVAEDKIRYVGNVMIDTLNKFRERANESRILDALELSSRGYVIVTLHRPSNVDDEAVFGGIISAFERIAEDLPIVFPMHPRTRANLATSANGRRMDAIGNLNIIEPLGYLDFLRLMSEAACVLTDSGGIQEETTILGVPCLTLRENTERPVTIDEGTNQLVGTDPARIVSAFAASRSSDFSPKQPKLWDGSAADRIVAEIGRRFDS